MWEQRVVRELKLDGTLSEATWPKQVDETLHKDSPACFFLSITSSVALETATCHNRGSHPPRRVAHAAQCMHTEMSGIRSRSRG